jgi:hypothetical protein
LLGVADACAFWHHLVRSGPKNGGGNQRRIFLSVYFKLCGGQDFFGGRGKGRFFFNVVIIAGFGGGRKYG